MRTHVRTNAGLTFILMMSATQPTCASLLSQQKCLRRERSVTRTVPPRYRGAGVARLDVASHAAVLANALKRPKAGRLSETAAFCSFSNARA